MREAHEAGAFDVRNVVGALAGDHGVILLLVETSADPETRPALPRKSRDR